MTATEEKRPQKIAELMPGLRETSQTALVAPGSTRKAADSDRGYEISLYADPPATDSDIGMQTARLKVAFPGMNDLFFNILSERIVANDFTQERLADAVNSVIDNFRYKELNVSDIIRFDRRVKLYSYSDVIRITGQFPHPDFERRLIDGARWYVRKADLI